MRVRNVVLVLALTVAAWLGAELVMSMLRAREVRPTPPIVLREEDKGQERGGKRPARGEEGRSSPSSGAEPVLPPAPPSAGDDDQDDDGGADTDDGDDADD